MARMGMDVDQVESAAKSLNAQATQLETLTRNLDKIVTSTLTRWEGPDAARFVNEAWPGYRSGLNAALQHIRGLIQSMRNNVEEQRKGSEKDGGGGSTPTLPHAPDPTPQNPALALLGPNATGVGTAEPPPLQRTYDSRHENVPLFGQGGGSNGQCTSWVHFRRAQLGLPAPTLWNDATTEFNTSPPTLAVSTSPSIGAVGSFYGHTFVVEGIVKPDFPREITISEMNVGKMTSEAFVTTGWDKMSTDTYTEISPGVWKSTHSGTHQSVTFAQ